MKDNADISEQYDIVVVGAGLVGAALALELSQRTRFRIALLERNPSLPVVASGDEAQSPDAGNQRVVALGVQALELLTGLGITQQLSAQYAHAYHSMMIWDENSDGELLFSAAEVGQSDLGLMVDAIACTSLMQQQAQVLDVTNAKFDCLFDTQLSSIDFSDQPAVLHTNRGELSARLVIGADGARSQVRQAAGIFANHRDYGQRAIVAKILTSRSHEDCAWQRFLSTGPLAALPVHDNYSSIVWSVHEALADDLMSLNDDDFSTQLAIAFEQRLGDVTYVGQRQSFALSSQQADAYIAPSLALVGDAVHSIHPLAGQGANLGFKDAAALSNLITQADRSELGKLSLLSRYERARKLDNQQTDWLMSALNTAYLSNSSAVLMSARGLGMNWINTSKRLKNTLARLAIGS